MATAPKNHPEWEQTNSLSSPSDVDFSRPRPLNQNQRNLTEQEVVEAVNALNNNSFVKKFPRIERRYADPVDNNQRIGLISFVPAKGAIPNEKGVYGYAKLRGNFATEAEANEKAESIIRNVDSYHQIYHAYVGRPFPITCSSDYALETSEVDIKNSMVESISNSIKNKKAEEKKQVEEIKQKEEELFKDSQKGEEDSIDRYTTLKVKKAQITWTYHETQKKMEEMKAIIIKTRAELAELDASDESLAKNYFEKYKKAREASGLDNSNIKNSFMEYMVEDVDIGF